MRQLTDDEVVAVLENNGAGVLALNDPEDPHPYSIPVAFGYDAARDLLAMQLEGDESSHKKRCLQRDHNVALTVYDDDGSDGMWRSVLIKGELVETAFEDAETALATLAQNTRSAPNPFRWGESGTVTPFELEIKTWSGRAFDIE